MLSTKVLLYFKKKQYLNQLLIVGCLFHFGQAVWRQVQNKGMATKYREDESFRLNVKKLIALAFVPVGDVIKAFDIVAELFDDDADDLLNYFEKTWVGERKRRGMFLNWCELFYLLYLIRCREKRSSIRSSIMECL